MSHRYSEGSDLEYLRNYAHIGDRRALLEIMARVPDIPWLRIPPFLRRHLFVNRWVVRCPPDGSTVAITINGLRHLDVLRAYEDEGADPRRPR